MSLIQGRLTCCDSGKYRYSATYDTNPKVLMDICLQCWQKEEQIKIDSATIKKVKILQFQVEELFCLSCGTDIKKAMGCSACHPAKQDKEKTE